MQEPPLARKVDAETLLIALEKREPDFVKLSIGLQIVGSDLNTSTAGRLCMNIINADTVLPSSKDSIYFPNLVLENGNRKTFTYCTSDSTASSIATD